MTVSSESKTKPDKSSVTIESWLRNSGLARLDAELILAHSLGKSREWLLAHDDQVIEPEILKQVRNDTRRRKNHEPLAYILGYKEFYGRNFIVTPDVLIPRPETEQLTNYVIQLLGVQSPESRVQKIIDIGCGSGCIGITLKLENPNLDVVLSDISKKALFIASENAQELGAEVKLCRSNLFMSHDSCLMTQYDAVVSNLPYVNRDWQVSPETKYEPETVLFADDNGLLLIKKLIDQAPQHLTQNGYLILELDPRQKTAIKKYATERGFEIIDELPFTLALRLQNSRS